MGSDGEEAVIAGELSNESRGAEQVTVHIRCSNGTKLSVQIELDSTVRNLKSVISLSSDIPVEQQRLIYKGRILKDDQLLNTYGLEAEHTVHLVRGSTPPTSSTPVGMANPAVQTNPVGLNSTSAGVGSNEAGTLGGSDFGASLFPGLGMNALGGNGGLFGDGLPDLQQMQQQLIQNPNMMRDMMNMPAVQNLMNNPEIMRNMLMNNPQMRDIIDRNPELAHVLNDPNILRQTVETARNPELMREMMRNTDRAMSNIEATPEGFNALRRMYETVQEPLLNATTMSGSTGNDSNANPFAALLGNQGGVSGRGPTTNPPNIVSDTTNASPAPNTNPLPNPWTPGAVAQANPPASGLSVLDLPGFESILRSTQDRNSLQNPMVSQMTRNLLSNPQHMIDFMQNPMVSEMMQSLLSNPQHLNQILSLNPQLRSTLDSNPHLREMMQNPEFIRQMTSNERIQQLLSLQSQLGMQQPFQESGQTGGGTGAANNMGFETLMNMFGGLGAGGGGLNAANISNEPPEQRFATQLTQLQEMGFFDTQENLRALIATAGNVHAAVERLLGNPGL